MNKLGFHLIGKANEDFESCLDCVHADDSEEICTMRKCVQAIKYLYDCYEKAERKDDTDTNVGKWISVSERLPKEEGCYPVVINGTDPVLSVKYEQGFAMGYYAPIDEAWEIDGHEDLINDLEVLAWMQLPPYTEVNNGN